MISAHLRIECMPTPATCELSLDAMTASNERQVSYYC